MKTFVMFTFALGLAACGGSSGSRNDSPDFAGPHTVPSGDLAMTQTGGSGDMAQATSGGAAGCKATIMCEQPCTTQACLDACDAMETSSGMQLENMLRNCVIMACPAQSQDAGVTTTNSPCAYDPSSGAPVDQSACTTCQTSSQSSGGACYAANMACNADT